MFEFLLIRSVLMIVAACLMGWNLSLASCQLSPDIIRQILTRPALSLSLSLLGSFVSAGDNLHFLSSWAEQVRGGSWWWMLTHVCHWSHLDSTHLLVTTLIIYHIIPAPVHTPDKKITASTHLKHQSTLYLENSLRLKMKWCEKHLLRLVKRPPSTINFWLVLQMSSAWEYVCLLTLLSSIVILW